MRQSIFLSLALSILAACSSEDPDPGPDASQRYDDCALWCSEIDTDPLNFPANQCPGPDDDTSYMLCLGECVGQHPDGHWCPPP